MKTLRLDTEYHAEVKCDNLFIAKEDGKETLASVHQLQSLQVETFNSGAYIKFHTISKSHTHNFDFVLCELYNSNLYIKPVEGLKTSTSVCICFGQCKNGVKFLDWDALEFAPVSLSSIMDNEHNHIYVRHEANNKCVYERLDEIITINRIHNYFAQYKDGNIDIYIDDYEEPVLSIPSNIRALYYE